MANRRLSVELAQILTITAVMATSLALAGAAAVLTFAQLLGL
jgi:hypothetical protein